MHPLRQAGIDITFQPKGPHQRLAKPFSTDAVIIDGQLFSAYMPRALWAEFPWPPYGASEEQALAYEQLFNERAPALAPVALDDARIAQRPTRRAT